MNISAILKKSNTKKFFLNIRKAQTGQDPDLFKKLKDEIWEFRSLYQGVQHRMLAFWDKTDSKNTLVISTHGFIKKRSKVPDSEINKAKQLRLNYFKDNEKTTKK
jgi:hypothetical protein